jgi:hypothetical protein
MRRAPLVLVTLLALGAGLVTTASAADDDGTLSVQAAAGLVQVRATGAVIGRIHPSGVDTATLRITDPDPASGGTLQLSCPDGRTNISAQTPDPDDRTIVCSGTGTDIRFRLVGGAFRLSATGSGINLSVVGKGHVMLAGTLTPVGSGEGFTTGTYSVNDGDPVQIPAHRGFALDSAATA